MSVQYVPAKTVEIVTPGTINVAEIEVYNIAGQNVARGASVDMSSVYPSNNKGDSRFGTRVANDGWLNSIDAKGEYHMIHTHNNSGSKWIRLTFPREESIKYIVVYNRASTDCCEDRLKGATVRALGSNNEVTYQTVVNTVENVYVFGPSASGKHYPLPSKGKTYPGKSGDNEENQFRQNISQCFGQGGLYDGSACLTTPPPTATAAPQPDEYIGKSLYIVRPLLKERYPDFEVLEVREDENLSSQVRPKTIIVRYRQLPIPPNVRAFPGSFTRVIDVSIPSTMAPVLPTAPLTITPAPALPTTTAPTVTATAPPIPTTPVPTTTVPSTDTPMPPPPETTTPVPTCPPLTEDETILDGNTGSLYRVQSGALRMYPDIQVYRSWGSPQYRVFPSDAISACFKGLPMEPKPTPTSLPTQSPSTTMPPISIETPGPAIDPTLYVMIHADTYENDGKLHVLATRFGGLVLEPYRTREYNQVFLTGSGYIRSAAGQGEYLEHNEECRVPLLTISPDDDATWQMQNTGTHQYKYRVLSACGGLLRAESGKTTVDLGTDTPDGTTWYIIPVGMAESG